MEDNNQEKQQSEENVQEKLDKTREPKLKSKVSSKNVIVVVLVAIAFVAGFYVNELISSDTDSETKDIVVLKTDSEADVEEEEDSSELVLSSDWLEFESLEYSVKLPNGWSFQHQDNGVLIMRCSSEIDCYEMNSGVQAEVEEIIGGSDGLQGLLVTIQQPGITEAELTSSYDLDSELADGFNLYKSIKTTEASFEGIGDSLPKGTVEYIAAKTLSDDRVAYFGYSVIPGQEDPTEIVEEMISTFNVL